MDLCGDRAGQGSALQGRERVEARKLAQDSPASLYKSSNGGLFQPMIPSIGRSFPSIDKHQPCTSCVDITRFALQCRAVRFKLDVVLCTVLILSTIVY